jgi:polar amino acid transport system substrate-binding protein
MRDFRKLTKAVAVSCALVFAGILASHQASAETDDAFSRITSKKEIRFGYVVSPPSILKDPASGELTGLFVDAARDIAELMKVKPVFVETTWANFASALQAGQFDMCIAATFATIPRAMAVSFTKPINYLSFSGVAKAGKANYKSIADLNQEGLRVAVVQGSAGHEFVRENLKKAKIIALSTANLQQPFLEVSAGRADIAIQDESQVRRYAPSHPEVQVLFGGETFNTLPIAWSVRLDDDRLRYFMNTAIVFMLMSGRWDIIAAKYNTVGRYKDVPKLVPLKAD